MSSNPIDEQPNEEELLRRASMISRASAAFERLELLTKWRSYKRPNVCLFFTNVIYVVSCLVVFGIGYSTVNEAATDANANVAFTYLTTNDVRPTPCGIPTTDALHLLQSFDRYEKESGMPQFVEPSYNRWVKEISGALCAGDMGWTSNGHDSIHPSALNGLDAVETEENRARELRAIAQLLRNWTIAPTTPITDSTKNASVAKTKRSCLTNDGSRVDCSVVEVAIQELEDNICSLDDNNAGDESFYSHRLRMAYGDLKTRVARAYVASAPAFYRYNSLFTDNQYLGCLGTRNPFQSTMCENSDHVGFVLSRAGVAEASMRLYGDTASLPLPEFPEMVYALLALSVLGHTDRTSNNGVCFKNDDDGAPYESALAFCEAIYDESEFPPDPDGSEDTPGSNEIEAASPMQGYADTEFKLRSDHHCDRNKYPPPPPSAPPFFRGVQNTYEPTTRYKAVTEVCASLMQYGLFDQGRLFGVPDVMESFVLDVRVGATSHVLAPPIYNAMFFEVIDKGGPAMYEPLLRLEVYLVYRMGSLTIWAMLISTAVGFFLLRSAMPIFIVLLGALGLRETGGKSATLILPPADVSTFMASITAILGGYWTLYTDPSIQAHYPISSSCDDWMFGEDHSSSGAYVTSWGKRRFSRYGEQQIGVVLFVIAVLPLLYSIAGACDAKMKFRQIQQQREESMAGTANMRDIMTFLIMFISAILKQITAAVQTGYSAGFWRDTIEAQADSTTEVDVFTRDCKMAVTIAFLTGAAVGIARQRWTVRKLEEEAKVAWALITVLTIWLQVFAYASILPDQWEGAFRVPSADRGRLTFITFLLASCFVETILIAVNLKEVFILPPPPKPPNAAKQQNSIDELENNTACSSWQTSDLSEQSIDLSKPIDRFEFSFTDAQLQGGAEQACFTSQPNSWFTRHSDGKKYLPMLTFSRS